LEDSRLSDKKNYGLRSVEIKNLGIVF